MSQIRKPESKAPDIRCRAGVSPPLSNLLSAISSPSLLRPASSPTYDTVLRRTPCSRFSVARAKRRPPRSRTVAPHEADHRHHPAQQARSREAALTEVEVFRLTVMDVQGFGRQKGHTELYRGHEFSVYLLRARSSCRSPSTKSSSNRRFKPSLKGASSGAQGEIGAARSSSSTMDDCIRIRTGERGNEAI